MRRLLFISGSALALAAPSTASMLWHSLPARHHASLNVRISIDPAADFGPWQHAPMATAEPDSGGGMFVPCMIHDSDPPGARTAALSSAPPALFRIAWGEVQRSAAPERSLRSRLSDLTQGHTPVILVPAATATVIIAAGLLAAARRR